MVLLKAKKESLLLKLTSPLQMCMVPATLFVRLVQKDVANDKFIQI